MDITVIGSVLSAIGISLALWSLWYARKQSKLLVDAHRHEIISLWAQLDRTRTLIRHVERLTGEDGFVKSESLTAYEQQVIAKTHKGLCEAYVRLAELIVNKIPGISLKMIEEWSKVKKLKSDWQKQQFINLISDNLRDVDEESKE